MPWGPELREVGLNLLLLVFAILWLRFFWFLAKAAFSTLTTKERQ